MVNLLALAADVMRKLAVPQDKDLHGAIMGLAGNVEDVALRLVDILYPRHNQDTDPAATAQPSRDDSRP